MSCVTALPPEAPTWMKLSTVSSPVTSGCSQPLSLGAAAAVAAASPPSAPMVATAASASSAMRCAAASASVSS